MYDILHNFRCAITNFSGQERFLEIRAFYSPFICNTWKKSPTGKRFWSLFCYILIKQHFEWEIQPIINITRAFFSNQDQGTFFTFQKMADETFCPCPLRASYVTEHYRYQNLWNLKLIQLSKNEKTKFLKNQNLLRRIIKQVTERNVSGLIRIYRFSLINNISKSGNQHKQFVISGFCV